MGVVGVDLVGHFGDDLLNVVVGVEEAEGEAVAGEGVHNSFILLLQQWVLI